MGDENANKVIRIPVLIKPPSLIRVYQINESSPNVRAIVTSFDKISE